MICKANATATAWVGLAISWKTKPKTQKTGKAETGKPGTGNREPENQNRQLGIEVRTSGGRDVRKQ